MKKVMINIPAGLLLLVSLFSASATFTQNASPEQGPILQNLESAGEKRPNCIPPEEFDRVSKQVEINVAKLRAEGILPEISASRMPNPINPIFRWPLRVTPEFRGFEPYAISNYPDQNTAANAIQDYNCGSRTYDGHNGTDIYLLPHAWNMMDDGVVDIVAAAPGTIVDFQDGNFDRNCSFVGNANYVILEHADGSRSWYWHMKNGSVPDFVIGEYITEGEYLGKVGSSGWSTGPHLHFEVHHDNGDVLDPWSGNCNALNNSSGWQNQKPYEDPTVVEMYTASANNTAGACPNPDNTSRTDHFNQPTTIKLRTYFRDINNGHTATIKVFRPDGTMHQTYNYSYGTSNGFSSNWGVSYDLALANQPTGTWRWEVTYLGAIHVKFFTVGCQADYNFSNLVSGRQGFLAGNTVTSTGTLGGASRVGMEAGSELLFQPGFWAKSGTNSYAKISPCAAGGN